MHFITRTLIVYSTIDGHTLKVAQHIQNILEKSGHQVTLMSVQDGLDADCRVFDRIVIGASIRYGKHHPSLYAFIARHYAVLVAGKSAFLSVSAVARNPDKATPAGNAYCRKFVNQSGWSPQLATVFGGKIDYAKYRLLDRQMIRFIMWITDGPTALDEAVEFTDWSAVDTFALQIKSL